MDYRVKYVFLSVLLVGLLSTKLVKGQIFQTAGNWNTATNWSTGVVPSGANTNVTVNATPSINASANNVIGNFTANHVVGLTVNTGGKLTVGSPALFNGGTKRNMIFMTNPSITISGILEVWGDLTIDHNLQLQISGTGQLIVHGNITIGVNANIRLSNSAKLIVTGDLVALNNAVIRTNNTSTINISGDLSLGPGSTINTAPNSTFTSATCTCTGCSTACNRVTLPITLMHFRMKNSTPTVELEWATASEINFDYFSIERSGDGKVFYEIAKVKGSNTQKEQTNYSYVDKNPLVGQSYYRLVSVDLDGHTETFDTVVSNYRGQKSVEVYPNPTKDGIVNVELNFVPIDNLEIEITDFNGAMLRQLGIKEQHTKIQLDNRPGVYLLNIKSTEIEKKIRIVVD